MRWIRWCLLSATFVVLAGGLSLAVLRAVDPDSPELGRFTPLYQQLLLAFVGSAILVIAYALLQPKPKEEPRVEEAAPPPPSATDVETAFQQMRTFVDLEMWELAVDKANYILHQFPRSREAEAVQRTIHELQWKAEPKFLARSTTGVSEDEAKKLQEKGLATMLKHVQTYIELEMWELAKQKAIAILKHFPDSKESAEVLPLYQAIEKKLGEPKKS